MTRLSLAFLSAWVALAAGACGLFVDRGEDRLVVQFRVPNDTTFGAFVVDGTNGALRITELYVLLGDVAAVPVGGACGAPGESGCVPLQVRPRLVELPVDSFPVVVAVEDVQGGRYAGLTFEVTVLGADTLSADSETIAEHAALARNVRARFPEWPADAGLFVAGTFEPDEGAARPFRVFAAAGEVVRLGFTPALVVEEDRDNEVAAVRVEPAAWFLEEDGRVTDLSAFDAGGEGRRLDLRGRLAAGFAALEDVTDE